MTDRSRRHFLKTSVSAAGLCLAGPLAAAHALLVDGPEHPAGRLEPFPLATVRLDPGIFKQQEEINARYLDSLTVDRLLHSFRVTAGISSSASPYKGWEDPTCELRGHFAGGHFLSAAALASAGSGNSVLKGRGDEVVSGLAACQKKIGSNYLSAYPTDIFEHLAQGKPAWAPFYTYHKIMAGLLDMHQLTGNTEALQIVEGMAVWARDYFTGISTDQRLRILRDEYGGMNEVLVNLAAVTKKDRYIEAAHIFEQPGFLDPLHARRDELQGLHANTHVPKIIGAAHMYEVTGDRRYREIAEYFLAEVLDARSYVIGNTSQDEHWKSPAGQLEGTLVWTNAECCVAYNLMKLQRHVFGWTADARWMDAYERALFNCRLGTQNAQGLKQYFFPLAAGYWRAYNSPEESFWCCTGTGAEEFAKFADTIYFRRDRDIFVNQFIASTLTWKDEDLVLQQVTQFPREQGTTLKVRSSRPAPRAIHVRIPSWTTEDAQVKINGRPIEAIARRRLGGCGTIRPACSCSQSRSGACRWPHACHSRPGHSAQRSARGICHAKSCRRTRYGNEALDSSCICAGSQFHLLSRQPKIRSHSDVRDSRSTLLSLLANREFQTTDLACKDVVRTGRWSGMRVGAN